MPKRKQWVGLADSTLHPKQKKEEFEKCVDCGIFISKRRRLRCIPCQEKYAYKLSKKRREKRRILNKNEKVI